MSDTDLQNTIERPSKTRLKQAMHELQVLGARLVDLSEEQLAAIGLPEPLLEAVLETRRVRSREGRRRQLQYLGKLMREVDPAPIREWFAALDGDSAAAAAAHHRIERWRERLLAGDDVLTEFARECPGIDLQPLRTCVRAARKERAAGKPPRHFRALFQLVKSALATGAPAESESESR